jgi:regulator of protease activity HflC (stomatin/prohibitin superfamily)
LNERETIEKNIEDKLKTDISQYGVIVDDVLVKDIDMPAEVLRVIEEKAKAEQLAKQIRLELQTKREQEDFDIETRRKELNFALEKQKSEAEQMDIEAAAIKNYQNKINESLTDKILKYKSIEITKELMKSPNTKIIITDGKTMMLNNISDK